MKEGLWDMLITMPPPHSSNAKQRVWPTVECPKGVPVKATQRDLRRFRTLTAGLARLAAAELTQSAPEPSSPRSEASDAAEDAPPPSSSSATAAAPLKSSSGGSDDEDMDAIVEPVTWTALAYNGFMWWASAGEKRRADELDEQSRDAALLAGLAPPAHSGAAQRRASFGGGGSSSMVDSLASLAPAAGPAGAGGGDDEGGSGGGEGSDTQARVELAVVAYFHRLTTAVLSVLADIVDSSDDDDLLGVDLDDANSDAGAGSGSAPGREEERDRLLPGGSGDASCSRGSIRVDSQALAQMGLDVWSQADANFVQEVTARYFSRRAYVETKGVEVCGVRVC